MTTSLRAVIDASVGIKKIIVEPLTPKVDRLFDWLSIEGTMLYVPDLFYAECGNAIWRYICSGYFDLTEACSNLRRLRLLRLTSVATFDLVDAALNIANTHSISVYDASYVALAGQVSAPLLTQDRRLVQRLKNTTFDVQLFANFALPPPPTTSGA